MSPAEDRAAALLEQLLLERMEVKMRIEQTGALITRTNGGDSLARVQVFAYETASEVLGHRINALLGAAGGERARQAQARASAMFAARQQVLRTYEAGDLAARRRVPGMSYDRY